ncbi:MAG: UDP-3-O-acyl-N-acetylglucosamine deacetylase [Pseudomonadota bacterium]
MQKTLKTVAELSGVGLHSGREISMTLRPAKENNGIVFMRTDIVGKDNLIPALWDHVVDTQLCTVIGNADGVTVGTIEHVMAALRGCGVDNLIIEVNGPEVPVMDGSSAPFVALIEEAGLEIQAMPQRAIKILKEVSIEIDGKRSTLRPSNISTFRGLIDFDHPSIGLQDMEIQLVNGNFKHDIAEARTFGFLHEVEYLRQNGLALGGSLDNAIVLDQEKVLNEDGLRFSNEFIRHKLLDAIGDLYLAGAPILGEYECEKPGHFMNNEILKAVFADPSNWCYEDTYAVEDDFVPEAEAVAA